MESPVGLLRLESDGACITAVAFDAEGPSSEDIPAILHEGQKQLEEYFAGKRREFNLPLAATGTAFQKRVWAAVKGIPRGSTSSYQRIAEQIGGNAVARAVGTANGANPIPIIVPCHRVIGADGSLTGYIGGLWRKQWLLRHEGALQADLFG
ncbi:MAG: methylated-DNA--[protein]-cysteine S-methyltransferase [Flavobacteriales bacterium]|nr:methylated-DNA--[protein]-cysteine S-methyltransferase [Flavobacteriales bacterium]